MEKNRDFCRPIYDPNQIRRIMSKDPDGINLDAYIVGAITVLWMVLVMVVIIGIAIFG